MADLIAGDQPLRSIARQVIMARLDGILNEAQSLEDIVTRILHGEDSYGFKRVRQGTSPHVNLDLTYLVDGVLGVASTEAA